MALAPAYHMARELPEDRRALPVLKVLYRNTNRIQEHGGRGELGGRDGAQHLAHRVGGIRTILGPGGDTGGCRCHAQAEHRDDEHLPRIRGSAGTDQPGSPMMGVTPVMLTGTVAPGAEPASARSRIRVTPRRAAATS